MFESLGRTEAFQEIEQKSARRIFRAAIRSCGDYGLGSERAVALMFDIRVQNGTIREPSRVAAEGREQACAQIASVSHTQLKAGKGDGFRR
jgi:hypothetical protein